MLPDPVAQPFLTVSQAVAAVPGWGERGIRQAIADGVLPAIRVGHLAIPTAALWRLAGLDPEKSEAGALTPAVATTPSPTEARNGDSLTTASGNVPVPPLQEAAHR